MPHRLYAFNYWPVYQLDRVTDFLIIEETRAYFRTDVNGPENYLPRHAAARILTDWHNEAKRNPLAKLKRTVG